MSIYWRSATLAKIIKNLFLEERWAIGYIDMPLSEFLKAQKGYKVNWILSHQKHISYADPFIIQYKQDAYIIFEKFDHHLGKGSICYIKFNKKTKKFNPRTCIECPHHIAYPCVFEHAGHIYSVLDESNSIGISLFRAHKFPSSWVRCAILINGVKASDPTIIFYKDKWWIFFTMKNAYSRSKLFIYYSDDLFGPWLPHRKNPVKTDIRSARPAGTPFWYNNCLIRPSQDCSEKYGGAITLNKIIRLTPEEFEEDSIRLIKPDRKNKYNEGIHTINSLNDMVFVDGTKRFFSLTKFINILKNSLGVANRKISK